ncbi:MAG: hypothetical protein SYR96_13825 [Actinomycetota bacterium]|nr:hypothetical protein [Actinomycetota bacterium]
MQQRVIYDERYLGRGYDERSAVRVLTAERQALHDAVVRARESIPTSGALSLLDFAYGTGRVTNEFAVGWPGSGFEGSLRVVAYDVSAVGLEKAAAELTERHRFTVAGRLSFDPYAREGYIAGSVAQVHDERAVSVVFVHGNEGASVGDVRTLLQKANDGQPFAVTTSWYSGIAHIPTASRREGFFRMLGELTDTRGEVLVAPSVSGDLVELQAEWAARLAAGQVGDHPIERPGDVMYETELGQQNFYHVFGTDLADLLTAISGPGQQTWIEAIRMPDEEFESEEAERDNYRRVLAFNDLVRHRPWSPEDYEQVHTALAVRSGHSSGAARSAADRAASSTSAAV